MHPADVLGIPLLVTLGAATVFGSWRYSRRATAALQRKNRDALVRLFAGEKALPIEKQGVVMKLFTKANAPKDGNFDWAANFPFEQEYKKAWGVG